MGNPVTTFTGNVTVELTAGTGTPGANLLGTRTVSAVSGVATFSTLSINRSGTGYTLFARASGLTGVTSVPFDVTPGAVTQLTFTAQPVTSTAGVTLPPVQVAARDSLGNTVSSFTDAVTLTIGVNPGGGTLAGGGVDLASFRLGGGYRMLYKSGETFFRGLEELPAATVLRLDAGRLDRSVP